MSLGNLVSDPDCSAMRKCKPAAKSRRYLRRASCRVDSSS